jgi:peptide/nickel transport system substrate-binding protein
MENRFGLKDFVLYALLGVLIVVVLLAMKQYDRQWDRVVAIEGKLDTQARELREIQNKLTAGVAVQPGPTASGSAGSAATGPAVASAGNDPFARIRAAQQQPGYARGDWLVDSFGNTVGKLTPLLSTDAYAADVQSYVLEGLADRDPATLEWKPLLSTGWRTIDNTAAYQAFVEKQKAAGKTPEEIAKLPDAPFALKIAFKMRSGVRFSDGEPLTADDVVFTYKFVMNERVNAPRDRAYLSRIKSVEKTAPDEVTFTFAEPYFEVMNLAAGMPILAEHFYGKYKPEDFNQSVGLLLGSGPYRMENPTSWKPGTLIQLVRNDNYWGVQPAFDRMAWKEIPNDVAEMASFRNGDTDLFAAAPEQYREMIADARLVERTQHLEYQNPVGGYRYVAWNEKAGKKPSRFADKRVRQALTMLLDRERMIQEISLGYAVLANGPFNPLSKPFNPDVQPWPYDVARAKQLLKEAGFEDRNGDGVIESRDGARFEFKLTYPGGNANYEKLVLFMKDAYARAGIVLRPDPLDWAVMVERLSKKSFEAISLGWTAGIETDIFQMFHSSQMLNEGDNFMSYRNPELDAVIEQARTTVDEAKRIPLWRKAHAILNEDQPYTFLSFGKSLVFFDKRLHNVERTKLGLNPRVEWYVPSAEQRWTR